MNLEHARKIGRVLGIGGQSGRLHKVAPEQQQEKNRRRLIDDKKVKPKSTEKKKISRTDSPSTSVPCSTSARPIGTGTCEERISSNTSSYKRADHSKPEKVSSPQHHNPVPERMPPASIMKVATLEESLHKYSSGKRGLFSTAATKHPICRSSIDDAAAAAADSASCADNFIRSSHRSRGFTSSAQTANQKMHAISTPTHSSHRRHQSNWRHRPPFHIRPTRSRSLSLEEENRISPEDWSLQRRWMEQQAQHAKEKPVQDGKYAWLPARYVDKDIKFGTVQFRYYNVPVLSAKRWIAVYDEDKPVPLEQYEMSRPPRRQLFQGRQESFAYNLYRELCDARKNS